MIGGGTVGGGVFQALERNGALLAARPGFVSTPYKIAVKAFDEPRKVEIPRRLLTLDWREVVNDPRVHIVAELAGGTTVAREMILAALQLGKPVVTANKALLSAHGEELFAAARRTRGQPVLRGQCRGGIPIIKALREGFVGNRILRLYGIVNGTCNYILTRMKLEGAEFADVLAEAQRLGYAEAEPSLDIDGYDSLAQDRHPGLAGPRLLGQPAADPRRGHPERLAARHPVRRPVGLHDQAARAWSSR